LLNGNLRILIGGKNKTGFSAIFFAILDNTKRA